eukprot:6725268-Pyramimonas_sp.AAC.1
MITVPLDEPRPCESIETSSLGSERLDSTLDYFPLSCPAGASNVRGLSCLFSYTVGFLAMKYLSVTRCCLQSAHTIQ